MSEHTAENDAPRKSILGSIAFDSIRATDDAISAGEPMCMCREGAYLGAQMLGTPIRCERCKRVAWSVETRIIRELKDELDRVTPPAKTGESQ